MKLYCDTTCEECDYFNLVKEQGKNILIITENKSVEANFTKDDGLQYRFVYSEYELSSAVESFRPDFIVIDTTIGIKETRRICSHISEDPRIPFARIKF